MAYLVGFITAYAEGLLDRKRQAYQEQLDTQDHYLKLLGELAKATPEKRKCEYCGRQEWRENCEGCGGPRS